MTPCRISTFFNFGYVALTIKQVNQHDAGTYSCVAYNKCGRADTSAKMTTLSAADADFQSKSWSSIQQLEMSKQVGNVYSIIFFPAILLPSVDLSSITCQVSYQRSTKRIY